MRDALGESADKPSYVETVARRGYRFLGEVERVGEPQAEPQPEAAASLDSAELPGKVLGHYRIGGKLGEGGMGVVYRALDLKLGRQVALKFLPCAADALPQSILQRFEREAQAASALNHPNICTIFGLEDLGGQPGIVMELVEGETLAARLARCSLPLDDVVGLAGQIAGALTEAHRRGVIHRDLKPANIMLTKSGVKVLDFGLAKMERPVTGSSPEGETVTEKGAIVGTLHYMSPEQVEGKEADARSDIFSFGLVLYEMATGKPAFEASSRASAIAAILEREPAAFEPVWLNRVVRACVAKDPEERIQTARDLKRALEWSASGSGAAVPAPRTSRNQRRLWLSWAAAGAATLGLAILSFIHFRERAPAPAASIRVQIQPPDGAEAGTLISMSPDGRKLAFISGGRLWVHFIETGESRNLTDATGTPFWSPNNRFIGYWVPGKLKKIEATGGEPQTLADCPDWGGGTWSQDGVIVFGGGSGLFQVPAAGGVPAYQSPQSTSRATSRHIGLRFFCRMGGIFSTIEDRATTAKALFMLARRI